MTEREAEGVGEGKKREGEKEGEEKGKASKEKQRWTSWYTKDVIIKIVVNLSPCTWNVLGITSAMSNPHDNPV